MNRRLARLNQSFANARRIVAYGLRNPFRFTIRPGTSEAWIGDVGWGAYEEIDRVAAQLGLASSYSFVLLIDAQGQVTSTSRFVRLPLVVR